MAFMPVMAAPMHMPMDAISSSACTATPPTSGQGTHHAGEDRGGRGDGVAGEEPAARVDGRPHDGVVAFQELDHAVVTFRSLFT